MSGVGGGAEGGVDVAEVGLVGEPPLSPPAQDPQEGLVQQQLLKPEPPPLKDIAELLQKAGLQDYEGQFLKEGVSLDDITYVDHWTLRELGISSIKDRLAFFRAVESCSGF